MSQDPEILRVAQGIPQPPCADWGKEHSHASRRCIWHCILQSDYHSLMRQSPDVMLSVLQAHLVSKKQVNEHPLWPRGANTVQQLMRQHTRDKLDFIILIMAIAHSKDERCGRLLSSPSSSTVEQRTPPSPPASEGLTCGPTSAFDVRSLPYRWLPGLPYPRTTLKEGQTAGRRRFEVMHIADYWPGPMWLYHAPGSGVWWDPGPRVIVARNLVDAVLKFKTMKEIIVYHRSRRRGRGARARLKQPRPDLVVGLEPLRAARPWYPRGAGHAAERRIGRARRPARARRVRRSVPQPRGR